MSRFRPVIRVFVSSTFSDMKHERNALAAEVYPKLEELCQKNGFQFQAIDLRWGVSTEAGLDHRTMRICFDELRRAQEISPEPNFLVLLGDRYGWRPLPEAISERDFEALERVATPKVTTSPSTPHRAGTNGEDRRGQGLDPLAVLRAWYRCDENVLLPEPPEADPDRDPLNYILQPRQNLGDGCDYTRTKDDKDTQDWLDVQQVLWSLINTAFPGEGRWFDGMDWERHVGEVNDPQHPKRAIPQFARFQASATEQEIWCGALSAANAERHVIACFREIANRGEFTTAEAKDFFDRTDSGEFDHAAAARQTALKEAIRLRLGKNEPLRIPFSRLKRESDRILLDASEADTKVFCDAVFEHFRPIIERQIEEYWHKSKQGSPERATRELMIEQDEHQRFGRERGAKESFVGREVELKAIRAYLRNASRQPLVVHGSSGCGKTALMWRAFEEIPEAQKPLIRLIGTTPHSSNLRGLLTSLCQELRQRNPREGALSTDIKELREEFDQHLRSAKPEQPLILFLDALDQLSDADGGRILNWIPLGQLPPHVKILVSCLSDRAKDDAAGQPWVELQNRQLPAENIIDLDALSEGEAKTLLFDRWLHQAGRTVSREQRAHIEERTASPVCCQPIYLKLLFEEAKLWRSYDAAPKLGKDVSAFLKQLSDRLSQPANHGPLLVDRVLGYLAASRYGLAETEILEILFADPEYKKALDEASVTNRHELPPTATRIPIAIWSRLRFDLAPYLTERAAPGANVLTIYHRQVAEWVQGHYAKAPDAHWQPHQRLAEYFESKENWIGVRNLPMLHGEPNRRKSAEFPWQLSQAHQPERLGQLLTNIAFLETKVAADLSFDLLDDFHRLDKLCEELPEPEPEISEVFRESFVLWRVLGNILDQVTVDPASIGAQIGIELQNIGAASSSQPREGSLLRRLDQATNDRPCFSRFSGGAGVPYLAQTALRQDFVHFLRFSADSGKLLYADAEGQIVQWNWSAPGIHQTKSPTTSNFSGAAFVSDQSLVMAGPNEAWMFSCQSLWDERFCSGTWKRMLTSEAGASLGAVAGCPLSGKFLVSEVGSDIARIVRFRGTDRIQPLRMPYVGGIPHVNYITMNSNEQVMAVCFGDGTLAMSTGFCAVVHPGGIHACAFLEMDMEIATIGACGVLAIRSLAGELKREVNLIQGSGTCLAYCPQHRLIVVGHRNGYISVEPNEGSDFEWGSGFWPGVRGQVSSICFSPCGKYLATAGSNGVVRVFEIGAVNQACKTKSIGLSGFPVGPIDEVRFLDRSRDLVFLDRKHKVRTDSPTADSRYLPFGCNCFCIDQTRDRIVAARNDEIYFLTPSSGEPDDMQQVGGAEKHSMTISSDGRFLALIENDRLFIYELDNHKLMIVRRLDLPLTQFMAVQTRPLNRAPLRFCRNGKLLAVPLESTVVESRNGRGPFDPDLRRNLVFVEVPSGQIVGTIGYRGFCTALDEIPEKDILIVGLGRGVVHVGSQEVICQSPNDAILFCSIEKGRCLQSRRLITEDIGVMGIAVERETNFKGCIVVSFESGRIRLTSLHSDVWAASICIPDPAVGVRFRNGIVQVADNGARRGNWPALHQFTLHFPIAK